MYVCVYVYIYIHLYICIYLLYSHVFHLFGVFVFACMYVYIPCTHLYITLVLCVTGIGRQVFMWPLVPNRTSWPSAELRFGFCTRVVVKRYRASVDELYGSCEKNITHVG